METANYGETISASTRLEIIQRIHKSLSNGIRSAKAHVPRKWLSDRKLSIDATHACFNSGQIHHHKPQSFKDELASVGFMVRSNAGTNAGQIPYTVFGIYTIMFPLKNEKNETVNFYSVGIENNKKKFMNEQGLYPFYPHETTKKLFITETILDAATLLESRVLDNRESVIALYDGAFLPQHEEAIKKITALNEIVFIRHKNKKD